MLVPPNNFGLVENGIYRCTKLESDNFQFLQTLNLRSLILLDAEKPPRLLFSFLQDNNIELFNLGGLKISNHHHHTGGENKESGDTNIATVSSALSIPTTSSSSSSSQWMLIEKNLIVKAFELILNKSKYNVLVVDSTSTLIGILRKIQKWNFNTILNEYRIYCGPSNSNNYYAETFLQLIQPQLISYELDQLYKKASDSKTEFSSESTSKLSSPLMNPVSKLSSAESIAKLASSPTPLPENITAEFDTTTFDDTDVQSIDDDEIDDDLLSASPQIPANLLKLVEQRKTEPKDIDSDSDISPSTSPQIIKSSSRKNSFGNDMLLSSSIHDRRRSSIDSKSILMSNNKFRNRNSSLKNSLDSSSFSFKRMRERTPSIDIEILKQRYDYKYYKNLSKYPSTYENVKVIKLKLPPESKLPSWFCRGRAQWEESYRKLNE